MKPLHEWPVWQIAVLGAVIAVVILAIGMAGGALMMILWPV